MKTFLQELVRGFVIVTGSALTLGAFLIHPIIGIIALIAFICCLEE